MAALGPTIASVSINRPWFPYIPEIISIPFRFKNSLINLQRGLIACFALFEYLNRTPTHSLSFISSVLMSCLIEIINYFVTFALRNTNSFENRHNILLRIHPVIIGFLMDINRFFEERHSIIDEKIRKDLNRLIRYCHNIFSLTNENARGTLLFQGAHIVTPRIYNNKFDKIDELLERSRVLIERIPDIYTQGPSQGRDHAIENVLFIHLINNTNFNIIPCDGIITEAFQYETTLSSDPIVDIPVVQGPPPASPPNLQHQQRQRLVVQGSLQNAARALSTTPVARSIKSSSDLTSTAQNDLHPTCKELLKSGMGYGASTDIINPSNSTFYSSPAGRNLRGFINKLKKSCNKVVTKKNCEINNLDDLRKKLLIRYRIPGDVTIIKNNDLSDLYQLYIFNNEDKFKKGCLGNHPNEIIYNDYKVKDINDITVDRGGPRRDFMQSAANQLFTNKLFKPINDDEPDHDVYCLNWDVNITPIFEIENTHQNKHKIFKFIGSFIAFLIINNIPLPYHLNRGILANLLYKPEEITNEEYALFYMLDDPIYGRVYINGLVRPEELDDPDNSFYKFNDNDRKIYLDPSININSPENIVTSATYRRYLTLLGKYKLINESKNSLALNAFKQGFFITRRTLRNQEITLSQLDALITSVELTADAIKLIKEKILNLPNMTYTGHRAKILNWFLEILENKYPYPIDVILEQGHKNVPKTYKEFQVNLMKWWTGINGFNTNMTYSLNIGTRLLSAHTCNQQFDIPEKYKTLDELYIDLIINSASAINFQYA